VVGVEILGGMGRFKRCGGYSAFAAGVGRDGCKVSISVLGRPQECVCWGLTGSWLKILTSEGRRGDRKKDI